MSQSAILADELGLTTAELSYLPERRKAYENLALRTGLDGVKAVVTTSSRRRSSAPRWSGASRAGGQENRSIRMNEAEKKAATLPPKLTVPLIVFFLPVLFAVIITPAAIQISSNCRSDFLNRRPQTCPHKSWSSKTTKTSAARSWSFSSVATIVPPAAAPLPKRPRRWRP